MIAALRRGLPAPSGELVPNLAPMVDVIMVVLIFFMVNASFDTTREGAMATELDPRSGPSTASAVEIIPSVKIGLEHAADGCVIYVLGQPLPGNTFDHLHRFLQDRRQAGADPANPIVVGPQGAVAWRYVVAAMDAAHRAGFANVQFTVSLAQR